MKVLIPFKDTTGLASNLRYTGYDVIEFTDDIQQFELRCVHCDAVFLQSDPTSDPFHSLALSIAYAFGKHVITWDSSGKDFEERELFKFELNYETLTSIDSKPDHRTLPKILIVGPGRCGKDSLGEFIHKHSKHTYAGSTSKFLAKYVAKNFGITEQQAYEMRHQYDNRAEIGNMVRKDDHGLLQKEALAVGNVVAGIRDFREAAWACYNEIYDHIIWIDADVEPDTTLTFTSHDIAVMLQGKKTKLTIIKNNKDSQFFADARKLIEAIK